MFALITIAQFVFLLQNLLASYWFFGEQWVGILVKGISHVVADSSISSESKNQGLILFLGYWYICFYLLIMCPGADINAICQEAGMHAVRENRYIVLPKERLVSV